MLLKDKESKSIESLKLNIQKFAQPGEPGGEGGSGEPGGEPQVMKFGDVEVPISQLPEDVVKSLSEAQKTYDNGVQFGQTKAQENAELNKQLEALKGQQNQNQQYQNAQNQQYGNPGNQQPPVPNEIVERLNKMENQYNETQINTVKSNKYAELVSLRGKEFADSVFGKVEADFNQRTINNPTQRNSSNYEMLLKYHLGEANLQPVEGMYNVNSKEDFLKMINDPKFIENMNNLQNVQSGGVQAPPQMVGNQNPFTQPINREQVRKDVEGMTRQERRAKFEADMKKQAQANVYANFLNNF